MAKAPKKETKKEMPMKEKKMPKKGAKCVVVTTPATLSVRDIIGAITELAPKVKSSQIFTYLSGKGFKVTENSVRAYKAQITRSIGA